MKKFLKWGAIIFIGLIIIGALAGDDTKPTGSTASDTASQEQKPAYDFNLTVPKVGTFQGKQSSDVGVAIVNLEETKSIPGSLGTKTDAGGKFIILNVVIGNNQKDAITFDSNLVKLVDKQGREFNSSTEGQTAIEMEGEEGLFLKQINPGVSTQGYIVFDVPEELKADDFKFVFKGGFMGDEAELPLKVMKK